MLTHLAPEDLEPSDLEKAHEEIRVLTEQLEGLKAKHLKLAERYVETRLAHDRIRYQARTIEEAQAIATEAWHFGPVPEDD